AAQPGRLAPASRMATAVAAGTFSGARVVNDGVVDAGAFRRLIQPHVVRRALVEARAVQIELERTRVAASIDTFGRRGFDGVPGTVELGIAVVADREHADADVAA